MHIGRSWASSLIAPWGLKLPASESPTSMSSQPPWFHCTPCQYGSAAVSQVGHGPIWPRRVPRESAAPAGGRSPVPPLSPHRTLLTWSMSHHPVRGWGMEAWRSSSYKTCCPTNPRYTGLYAEQLIYCFIRLHNDPHLTQEEVEARRGEALA